MEGLRKIKSAYIGAGGWKTVYVGDGGSSASAWILSHRLIFNPLSSQSRLHFIPLKKKSLKKVDVRGT